MESINFAELSPVEVDLLLLERMHLQSKAHHRFGIAKHYVLSSVGKEIRVIDDLGYKSRYKTVYVSPDTVEMPTHLSKVEPFGIEDALRLVEANDVRYVRYLDLAKREVEKYVEALDAYSEALALVHECDVEYSRRPWSRYWLVTSSDGHIHSSTSCSTCNKGKEPTGFALVAYLSGASVEDAVADLGSALCSVCFPDAPVESREQVRISASLALRLREDGVEAFIEARAKAQADAEKRSSERCEGSGSTTVAVARGWHACPTCGWTQRPAGKVRAHRRPYFFAVRTEAYASDKYWTGTSWGASTKKVTFSSMEEAQAIVDAHGGTSVLTK